MIDSFGFAYTRLATGVGSLPQQTQKKQNGVTLILCFFVARFGLMIPSLFQPVKRPLSLCKLLRISVFRMLRVVS